MNWSSTSWCFLVKSLVNLLDLSITNLTVQSIVSCLISLTLLIKSNLFYLIYTSITLYQLTLSLAGTFYSFGASSYVDSDVNGFEEPDIILTVLSILEISDACDITLTFASSDNCFQLNKLSLFTWLLYYDAEELELYFDKLECVLVLIEWRECFDKVEVLFSDLLPADLLLSFP